MDGLDFDHFEACFCGPTIPYNGDCSDAGLDTDTDVDQKDFGIFQRCYSGQGNPADPNCADRLQRSVIVLRPTYSFERRGEASIAAKEGHAGDWLAG